MYCTTMKEKTLFTLLSLRWPDKQLNEKQKQQRNKNNKTKMKKTNYKNTEQNSEIYPQGIRAANRRVRSGTSPTGARRRRCRREGRILEGLLS